MIPIIGAVDHLFLYLLVICVSSFVKWIFEPLAHLLWFIFLIGKSSASILDTCPLSDTCIANIFSLSVLSFHFLSAVF